jgi:hypothetical protein
MLQLIVLYGEWAGMDNVEFLTFVAPENHVSRALFLHYITVNCLMKPVYAELMRERSVGSLRGEFLVYCWAEAIYHRLPWLM